MSNLKNSKNLHNSKESNYSNQRMLNVGIDDLAEKPYHTGRNCFTLFQISFSGNTADAHPEVSGVSKDQKFCEKFKNTHCQVDHPAKIE